jgi:hypothetical protein
MRLSVREMGGVVIRIGLLLALLVAAGCASQQAERDPVHEDLRVLPARFADEPV